MNNIYKVIWSKAKNCYVVASEIARSHTKSATGSEKIGGVTRRSLLASLMALSLLCGGLGVASASLEVVDQSGTAGTVTIYTKDEVDKALEAKGAAIDVASNTANIATNKDNITQLDTKKLDKDLANSTFATKDALNGLAATVNNKVDESVVETALDGKADKADTLAGYGIKDAYTKGDVDNKLNEKADAANVNTALAGKANVGDSYTKAEADGKFATSEALNTAKTDLEGKITSAKNELDGKITANTQKIGANETAITDLKDADVRLEGKINQNTNDITGLKDKDVELSGKIDNNKNLIDQNAANITQNKNDIAAIGGRLTTAEGNIQTNADAINALDTKVGTINNGNYLDGTKSVGENLNALDAQTKTNTDEIARVNQELVNTNNHFNTELGKTNTALNKEVQERVDADTKLTGRIDATDKRTAGIKRTDTGVEEDNQTVIEGKVHFDQNGNVSDVKDLSAETITTTGDAAIGGALGVTGATTLDGALMANGEATFKEKVTVEKDLTVNGKLNVGEIYLKNDKLESTGKKHDSATSITADGISNLAKVTEHGNTIESQFTHNEKGTFNHAKDGTTTDWKESTSNVTANGVANVAKDSKGNNNTFTQTSTDTKNILTDKDGNTSTTRQDGKGIYGYAKDKDGNKSYTKQEGNRIAESVIGKDGTETKSEMTSTDITNTAKDGTITNDAKDIVNNATGDMTNTVGGNLTTTVGGNENHEVKGTKTETVEGKVTENFKGGQETNVTGDQTTNVSGTQTTNATDINRNASSGMIDKVDNDYGTNTETKVAGKTTTDVSIKGTGEKGQYIRGANESRDYLIKGTLKNSETKTAEATSTEITDGNGKISTTIQDVTQISGSVTDGTNTSVSNVKADSIDSAVAGGTSISTINQKKDSITSQVTDGTTITKTEQTAKDITNTAKDGTITNDAKDIVNKASGDMTNTVGGKLTTTVTGATEENYNGGLTTKVTGEEKHTVTGKQTNTVEGGQENIISGGQTNTITGGQVNNITGDQTTTITGNKKETVTENVTEDYKKNLSTTVGGNEIHEVKGTKTETVEGKVTENFKGGQETNVTGDQTTNVSGTQTTNATDINRNASSGMIDKVDNDYGTNTETKVAGKTTTDVSIKGTGEKGQYIRGANESRDYLIKGTLKNSETKTAEATSTEITDGNGKTSSTIQDVTQISGSVTDGTNTSVSNVKANSIDSAVTDGSSISTINQKKNSITSQVTDGTTITKTEQDTKNITNTAKDGTITNDAKDIVNNASGNMTNTVGGDLKTTVSGNELHEVTGTKTENVTGKVTENYKAGQETNVTGDQDIYVTGKQTNKIDGDQENTIGGSQTTTVTGDILNKAENITNEANTKLTDKVGDNTRVLDSEGITDTVGGSTFKQRIDKIMMESKDVSIKAEETLTNEAKVITNKASEVINNEAVNINNTATGIITSKAFEIKNQADKLISNKVGENTWENMENGKITTSIKDGAKQNLTQSDAAGTTQSTVDGGKSTVTIQNADGLADAVTDGTNTSVQNQTASAIAAAVKDGAGNENASVANATTSVNTIKSGSKANTVISTADGTSFINSEAAAPVGDGTEVKTTIKGNTITTGKVTMDYAEVMKDLGVRGNANITGKTTTGSLEVTGTSTLKGDVTMESSATVKKNLTVEGNTNLKNTKVDGTLDVTQKATFGDSVSIAKDLSVGGDVTAKSYKVGDKTYISAAGINANDQKITNVADGSISEGSKDAVNGGQLYGVKNDLEGKVNKVGANAAAMANLHPMEFDPDSKWNIAAAIGNYGSETAAALGAFYRPNDDVMVNLSTAFGTGENMVGGGVSVRLGKSGNKLSREESNALKDQVNDLTARMDALLSVLNPNMSKDFPDVPENHWAYEAVSRLAGNDIIQGYPDGEFHGDRTMTRYEMAEIIYNALSRGAEAEKELVEEFKPELQAMAASEKATAEKAEG